MVQAIFNAAIVAVLTWLAKSSIGLACALAPRTFGGPVPDSVTSHGIMVGGGALATFTLFWPKIQSMIGQAIRNRINGGAATPVAPGVAPGVAPAADVALGEIPSLIMSVFGSDARLAPLKLGVDYLLKIPQVLTILDSIKNYGWPTWWYIGIAWPGKPLHVAAAGTLPANLPMPSPPPPVVAVQPAATPVNTNPPPVLVDVQHAPGT